MASPAKTRRLPAWAGASMHAPPPTGREIKNAEESFPGRPDEGSQEQVEVVTERSSGEKAGDVVSEPTNKRNKVEAANGFSTLMEGIIFTISGIVNPERTELRNMALSMGAQYRSEWGEDSTLLVCPFAGTPTFRQVQAANGTIVHKDWIAKSFEKKGLVAIEEYLLHIGKPWKTESSWNASRNLSTAMEVSHPKSFNLNPQGFTGQGGKSDSQTARNHLKDGNFDGMNQIASTLKSRASPNDLQQWALEDFAAMLTWLEEQNEKPEEYELESVAAQGLLVCLDDAIRSLQENQGLSLVMDNWSFIPKAVKKLEMYQKEGECVASQLVAEGERFKVIYESQLKKLGFGLPSACGPPRAAKAGGDGDRASFEGLLPDSARKSDKDVDDDATDIISDTDSRDPADFDSDNTEELDEDEIAQCQEQILRTLGLH